MNGIGPVPHCLLGDLVGANLAIEDGLDEIERSADRDATTPRHVTLPRPLGNRKFSPLSFAISFVSLILLFFVSLIGAFICFLSLTLSPPINLVR